MVNEILVALALGGITLGAFLSTWAGKTKAGEPYNVRMFISSLIISTITGYGTINIEAIESLFAQSGWILTFVGYLIGGFLLDVGLSKLDKPLIKTT